MLHLKPLCGLAMSSVVVLGCSHSRPTSAASHRPIPKVASSQTTRTDEAPEPIGAGQDLRGSLPPYEEQFLRRFVTAYQSGKRTELVELSLDSKGVILLDNWNGLRVSGLVFPSLQALLKDGNTIAAPHELFPGEFVSGPWHPGTNRPPQRCPWAPGGPVVFGKLSDPAYFFEWGGTKVDFGDSDSRAAAEAIAREATHFVYSTSSNLGFVFARSDESWFLVGIDLLATDC